MLLGVPLEATPDLKIWWGCDGSMLTLPSLVIPVLVHISKPSHIHPWWVCHQGNVCNVCRMWTSAMSTYFDRFRAVPTMFLQFATFTVGSSVGMGLWSGSSIRQSGQDAASCSMWPFRVFSRRHTYVYIIIYVYTYICIYIYINICICIDVYVCCWFQYTYLHHSLMSVLLQVRAPSTGVFAENPSWPNGIGIPRLKILTIVTKSVCTLEIFCFQKDFPSQSLAWLDLPHLLSWPMTFATLASRMPVLYIIISFCSRQDGLSKTPLNISPALNHAKSIRHIEIIRTPRIISVSLDASLPCFRKLREHTLQGLLSNTSSQVMPWILFM